MAIPTHILSPLVDALAELYPEPADARAMARVAGLDETQIDFSGRAGNTWTNSLREAEPRSHTPALPAQAQTIVSTREKSVTQMEYSIHVMFIERRDA